MTTDAIPTALTFAQLGLSAPLVAALTAVGYETPTPIQQQTIPALLTGQDLIGQAQTGTGKTAAFALPILEKLDLNRSNVQALILTPTRELAIQVAEAVYTYSKQLGRVKVTPIYGGDSMQKQLTRLRSGVHVVVGTPGRVMDHLRRGTLVLSGVHTVVLDEADEMLRMGFLEDVEWILSQAGEAHQTALFSATLPREVRRIADRYLKNPVSIEIKHKTMTVPTVDQQFIQIKQNQKLDVLTRLLEAEAVPGESILIFARTKLGAADLAEHLEARGYAVEAMHGDMNQSQRESVIRRMREGLVEIVVATDVAARGLDVEHIGIVVNYDIPNDPESYVHRIGRTARAGRSGKAISLITPREDYMMREIERYTGKKLTAAKVPTHADVAAQRREQFKKRIIKALAEEDLKPYVTLIEEMATDAEHDLVNIAAAAAWLARGSKPLSGKTLTANDSPSRQPAYARDRSDGSSQERPSRAPRSESSGAKPFTGDAGDTVMVWVGAGLESSVRPADLVGAIANEAHMPGREIGPIAIYDSYSVVGIPGQYVNEVLQSMSGATIRGNETGIRLATGQDYATPAPRSNRAKPAFGSDRKPAGKTYGKREDGPRRKFGDAPDTRPASDKPRRKFDSKPNVKPEGAFSRKPDAAAPASGKAPKTPYDPAGKSADGTHRKPTNTTPKKFAKKEKKKKNRK